MTEKAALARTLNISRELYSALVNGVDAKTGCAMLDTLSAALSHLDHGKKPLRKCMRNLKHELKSEDKAFYLSVKRHFSILLPTLNYDYEKAAKHVPALIYGNDKICRKLIEGEHDRAKAMADAMKSYPSFLFGEFEALSDEQFYDLVFGFYPKLYEEQFMEEMRRLFI